MQCHGGNEISGLTAGSIALVGHPNVGKSALFQRLTGQRVAVSNYPGTTVELARGQVKQLPRITLVDTPGVITLPPHSEDEEVTARVLLNESLQAILQVGDAKNLRRTLLLTVQLAEMSLPLVLALNMMDEASARGLKIDLARLGEKLSIAVIPTTAVKNQGTDELVASLTNSRPASLPLSYTPEVEVALAAILKILDEASLETPIAARSMALAWLNCDPVSEGWLNERLSGEAYQNLISIREDSNKNAPLAARIYQTRLEYVDELVRLCTLQAATDRLSFSTALGRLTTHPFWGLFILAGVLYALYWFVGVFGAGFLVNLLEKRVFGELINPWVTSWIQHLIPWEPASSFLVGNYGLWTMGMTYAMALILPIVTIFFLAFGVLEDSGYLPRLVALSNRLFQMLGLNGKAVLPMVLGLGCVTMATLTTRVLESKRERLMVTVLLALAVPCSAQLGVVMGMLAGISLGATLIWAGVIFLVMIAVGWLSARLIPGERVNLLVELPPLRFPQFSNVALKTLARLEWYVKEVIPLFLVGAALMFGLDRLGILGVITKAGEPLVTDWLGLPPQASAAFLMGFLRRDFGATGLFVMQSQGLMTPVQVVVAMVTITLFIPCIASVMMIAKERGWRTATGMLVFITPLAFLVGGLLYRMLIWFGWT